MRLYHSFISPKADGVDVTLVKPSNWNAALVGGSTFPTSTDAWVAQSPTGTTDGSIAAWSGTDGSQLDSTLVLVSTDSITVPGALSAGSSGFLVDATGSLTVNTIYASSISVTNQIVSGSISVASTAFSVTSSGYITAPDLYTQLFSVKNLSVNGGMEVSQEFGTTAQTGVTSDTRIVDCVAFGVNSDGVFTCQQVADAPSGLKYSAKVTVTTADSSLAAGQEAYFEHAIEGYQTARLGWGASGALSVSIGLWIKANRTGNYSLVIWNNAFSRGYATTITIDASDTWEYKTFTIPGDTSGTWDTTNGAGLRVAVVMASNNSLGAADTWGGFIGGVTGMTNGIAAVTDYMNITGLTVVTGSVPVPQERTPEFIKSFDDTLIDCKRFWEKSYNYGTAVGSATTVGAANWYMNGLASGTYSIRFNRSLVQKRTIPTMIIYSTTGASSSVRDDAQVVDVTGTATLVGENSFVVTASASAANTIVNMKMHWTANARL